MSATTDAVVAAQNDEYRRQEALGGCPFPAPVTFTADQLRVVIDATIDRVADRGNERIMRQGERANELARQLQLARDAERAANNRSRALLADLDAAVNCREAERTRAEKAVGWTNAGRIGMDWLAMQLVTSRAMTAALSHESDQLRATIAALAPKRGTRAWYRWQARLKNATKNPTKKGNAR
ncbi:MAG: hypothetical protein JNK53_00760 [Phycisphaerae bacterium]|nr:hypothetical protein [Phycisphaerae bacterium]